jgi:endonuclease/exonuclease/phosphatase family metal-dependent hydrolase
MIILLGDFNKKLGRENIFKPTNWNESLHQDSTDNGVRIVNCATQNYIIIKSTMFPYQNIQNYTWTSRNEKTHNQIDRILIKRTWQSIILYVQSFGEAEYVTDHYLVFAKFREILAVRKAVTQKFVISWSKMSWRLGISTKSRSQTSMQLWRI